MLTECPLQHTAFPSDVREQLGGWCQVAGFDLEDTLPKSVKDHPWIGQTVFFPIFATDGYVDGKIIDCIVHPLGKLMFDIQFPTPVPPIHGHGYCGETGWEVVLRTNKDYHQQIHRMFGDEIAELVKECPKRKSYE